MAASRSAGSLPMRKRAATAASSLALSRATLDEVPPGGNEQTLELVCGLALCLLPRASGRLRLGSSPSTIRALGLSDGFPGQGPLARSFGISRGSDFRLCAGDGAWSLPFTTEIPAASRSGVEPSPVAASSLYPDTPREPKARAQTRKSFRASCCRRHGQLTQTPAQLIQSHGHVHVKVCVDAHESPARSAKTSLRRPVLSTFILSMPLLLFTPQAGFRGELDDTCDESRASSY